MLDNHDNRNLSDVFKELQEMQQVQTNNSQKTTKAPKAKKQFAFPFRTKSTYQKCYDSFQKTLPLRKAMPKKKP